MSSSHRLSAVTAALLTVAAMLRIAASYGHTAQAFDEPCHIAAGIEFLVKKTYTLDPVHPPLSRIAIALPLYLAGERYPKLTPSDPGSHNYNVVGNHIIYDSGHFRRNLALARIGLLPFFVLGSIVVYLWGLRLAGSRAAVFAVLLYTTTPTILAFSSIAYTDIVAASTQLGALFAFSLWLEAPDGAEFLGLAVTVGLAVLAKLTSILFLPAAACCMFVMWVALSDKQKSWRASRRISQAFGVVAVAAVIVWAGYAFSLKSIQEATGLSPTAMPSFQNFPQFARSALRWTVIHNPRFPGAEFLNGAFHAWVLDKAGSTSYLFGHIKTGGWWYFYLCALCVKLPVPLLILFSISLFLLVKVRREPRQYLPLAGLLGILLITTHVSYQVGVRHILACFPLFAIVTATGLKAWLDKTSWFSTATILLVVLTVWQVGEGLRSQPDFLAYFNELAGRDPGKILSMGCDLDCGQDLYRLAEELRSRDVRRVTLAIWTSAEVERYGLPTYDLPNPQGEMTGWVALSSRALRIGDVFHQTVPPHTFDWLEYRTPVVTVGTTIKLYYIGTEPNHNKQ